MFESVMKRDDSSDFYVRRKYVGFENMSASPFGRTFPKFSSSAPNLGRNWLVPQTWVIKPMKMLAARVSSQNSNFKNTLV
jgi:hypothetical protein